MLQGINNIVHQNTFLQNEGFGLRFFWGPNNIAHRNNFVDNGLVFGAPQLSNSAAGNSFSFNSQGNYYNNFDQPSEGCNDLNGDGKCDAQFNFPGGSDQFAFTDQDGWLPFMKFIGSSSPGYNLTILVSDIEHPLTPFITGVSGSSTPPIIFGNSVIPLAYDGILITWLIYGNFIGATNYIGTTNQYGKGYVNWTIPAWAPPINLKTAFITVNPAATQALSVSPAYDINIP